MIRLSSADIVTTPQGRLYCFNPIDGLDVPALKGQIVEVDGAQARVVDIAENALSSVRPTHFTAKLEFTATPDHETLASASALESEATTD